MNYFYNEDNKRIGFDLNKNNKIGNGLYGTVYLINDSTCLKRIINFCDVDYNVISLIRMLNLKNFYEILDILFNKNGNFRAYTMRYYKSDDIDILTMPTEYTLENLYNIYSSVLRLTEINIKVTDMHDENVIINKNAITIIDVDLFTFPLYISHDKLLKFNVNSVRSLFKYIYYNNISKNYFKYNFLYNSIIDDLYNKINYKVGIDSFCRELEGYKYPIDYIKKLSKTRGVK